jgi:acyl dehydratase
VVREQLHFEDFQPGQVFVLGERTISEEEIVAFARVWDPLEFHSDPVRAAEGPYGGLIASGRHSCLIWMRLYVDSLLNRAAGMGSPGVDEIVWHVPVRPGDTLRGTVRIVEAAPSSKRDDRGTVSFEGQLLNQEGEVTTTIRGRNYFARRSR